MTFISGDPLRGRSVENESRLEDSPLCKSISLASARCSPPSEVLVTDTALDALGVLVLEPEAEVFSLDTR